MTIQVHGSAVVRTRRGVGDWTVWAVEQVAGIARVEERHGLTEVVIGDAPRLTDDTGAGFTALACTVDGTALVICHDAPPALLLTANGLRTAPAEPGGRELLDLKPDERLLLLSASVLDARPEALSEALYHHGGDLIRQDPVSLLAALFREVHHGAGAVVGPAPGMEPTGGGA
ncbi:hypothetical protein SAMN04489867_2357 [Pedococcus dokdonensis]|uniref:Uncharacterized protein n=1 Tax=Pedococcus dokdonensis TaxID=443156 RepID=A0A1H0SGZ1_9MICO|nr:hypothetical protein [Pedococcus dokdonensis]SDP40970.1 hypothetical protein SAMN04489867_2357 [Pedococcus dokdonensis]